MSMKPGRDGEAGGVDLERVGAVDRADAGDAPVRRSRRRRAAGSAPVPSYTVPLRITSFTRGCRRSRAELAALGEPRERERVADVA